MSQDYIYDLIMRVRIHCQQAIYDVTSGLGWARYTHDFVEWYIPERKTGLVLTDEAEPTLAFTPATEQQIKETEQQLGFSLPPLLRLLYTQIGNGGFGPGQGITGVIGGYHFSDISLNGDIAQVYFQAVNEANTHRQSHLDYFQTLDPEEQQERERSGWVDALPSLWPEHLLPLCQWGCNISTYINADTSQIFQGMSGPDLFIATSLEEWLERWLAGEELQFL